jgi:beta-glucosidase
VQLAPGESKKVTLTLAPRTLSIFNARKDAWELKPGTYTISVGRSAIERPLSGAMIVRATR